MEDDTVYTVTLAGATDTLPFGEARVYRELQDARAEYETVRKAWGLWSTEAPQGDAPDVLPIGGWTLAHAAPGEDETYSEDGMTVRLAQHDLSARPLQRFYVRWDLETWNEGEAVFAHETFRGGPGPVGHAHVTAGGTVMIQARSIDEAREIASYSSERMLDVDFLGGRMDESVVESYPQPFTDAEQDHISYGRCYFRVTSVVPVGDSAAVLGDRPAGYAGGYTYGPPVDDSAEGSE